jgi:hypothetical protein
MPQCQFPVFSVFVFRKATQEIFSELDKTKAQPSIFTEASQRPKMRRRGARGWPHPRAAQATVWPCHQGVSRPSPPSDATLSPINSPRLEKPKKPIYFPGNILQAAAVAVARSGGSRSSSRHPTREGIPCQRPSTPPWLPPELCVSSLPRTMGP